MISHRTLQKPRQGFTLVELLVAMAIFAILGAIAAPSIQNQMAKRRMKNAATDLYSTIVQARVLAINSGRIVEIWPAYTSWNVPKANRDASIRLPNTADVSKAKLVDANLSWYVVTAGVSTGTGAYTLATSTNNSYPIQVSLPSETEISVFSATSVTAASMPTSGNSINGLRFFPTGGMSNVAVGATSFITGSGVVFTVCDSAIPTLPGYTIILTPSGGVRTAKGAVCT
jgi:prepilin-type N-terminal cleavage/methylation domain-containing protein